MKLGMKQYVCQDNEKQRVKQVTENITIEKLPGAGDVGRSLNWYSWVRCTVYKTHPAVAGARRSARARDKNRDE